MDVVLTLENMLSQGIGNGDLILPRLAHVPELVLRRLRDKDCNLREVADIIAEDQATSTRVLRAAKSVLLGVPGVTSLQTAVVRLGINQLRSIMMSESLSSAMFTVDRSMREPAFELWRRALSSACIMRSLGGITGIEPEYAFLVGLLHDIGSLVVLRLVGSYNRLSRCQVTSEAFEFVRHRYHQEFGERVAKAWELPPQITQLAAEHHTYPEADNPLRKGRLLLILTEMVNQMLGYAPPISYRLLASRPVVDLGLADNAEFVAILDDLPETIEERNGWEANS